MNQFLKIALEQAKLASKNDDVPVGCVIVKKGKIISKAYNKKELLNNPLYHAEIIAINEASKKLNSKRLDECELYVTLKPCIMCIGAIINAKIKNVYYGAEVINEQLYDDIILSKYIKLIYLKNIECSSIISDFFKNKRK